MSYTLDQDGNEIQEILNKAASAIEEGTQEEHESPSGVEKLARLDRLVDSPFANKGFKNHIINGNFDIWQRGTSFSATTDSQYSADRWRNNQNQAVAASRQEFTPGQTDVPGEPTYFHRSVVSAGDDSSFASFQHRIESVRTLAGQKAVLSFYAKADEAKNITVGGFQDFGSGGSPSDRVWLDYETISLTTTWQRFEISLDVPSIAGKTLGTAGDDYLGIDFVFSYGSSRANYANRGSLGHQSGTFDIAQVQIEAGPIATPFEQRPLGVEEQMCYRYYWSSPMMNLWVNPTNKNRLVLFNPQFPVNMRGVPTISTFSQDGTASAVNLYNNAGAKLTVSSISTSDTSGHIGFVTTATDGDATSHYIFRYNADAEL